jgi:hypothetical protein
MRELFTAKAAADPYNSGVYNEITVRRQQKEWEEICDGIETSVILDVNQHMVRRISSDIKDRLLELGYEIDYHEKTDMYVISWWEDGE